MASCGRYAFELRDDGGGATDSDARATDDAIDALSRPNVVFVTTATSMGTFGNGALGALGTADQVCAGEAAAAGLPGTFVAWITAGSTTAASRLAGSRGWIRPDGVPVADDVAGLTSGQVYNPISLTADGTLVNDYVWTGTTAAGALGTFGNCGDWTSSGGNGTVGHSRSVGYSQANGSLCDMAYPFLCFEVGNVAVVSPPPKVTPERIAFLSHPLVVSTGRGAFDTACATDAANASLPGTYLAAVATMSESIRMRFTSDARQWTTVDGAVISTTFVGLLNGSTRQSPINQLADGTRVGASTAFGNFVWTGALDAASFATATSNCSDWTNAAMPESADTGDPDYVQTSFMWKGGSNGCNGVLSVLCLQQ